jgi:hypothetical protein
MTSEGDGHGTYSEATHEDRHKYVWRTTAYRLKEALRCHVVDPGFADDLERAQVDMRAFFDDDMPEWDDACWRRVRRRLEF